MRPDGCRRSDIICESEPLSIFNNIANARMENRAFFRWRLSSSPRRISATINDAVCGTQRCPANNCGKICAGSPDRWKWPTSSIPKLYEVRWIGYKVLK
jgi:hypothetical protein